jgi:hypothetical protein
VLGTFCRRGHIEFFYHTVKKLFKEIARNGNNPIKRIELLEELYVEVIEDYLSTIKKGKGTAIFTKLFIDLHEHFLSGPELYNQISRLSNELGLVNKKVLVK